MASQYDESEFVDTEYQAAKSATAAPAGPAYSAAGRGPTRAELDSKVGDTQQRLAELKRAQEELERERAGLEEARRRQSELHTGREEMLHHLARGLQLLTEAEFAARRESEQMTKTLAALNESLTKLQGIQEEGWSKENWNLELTRALTIIENARMEWNSARLKWPLLDSAKTPEDGAASASAGQSAPEQLASLNFFQLCKLGLALTWPLLVLGSVVVVVLVLRR
ncbi:MAG: hypothetical protein HZA89_00940 [Verrucomicrobia bacterium]|nr:hypothetical protein [Verrucomicrobiota bacterium]